MADAILDKIISYPVGANGELGAGRDEITTGLFFPRALAFFGGRVYVVDNGSSSEEDKILSYPVGADGELGAGRDEITTGLDALQALAFLDGRAYVAELNLAKIISYPVGANGRLGAGRDEIATGLRDPTALAFSGGRAYVADTNFPSNKDKIISYPVGAGGILGVGRDEITTGLNYPFAIAFSGGRAYVINDGSPKIISYPLFSSVAFAVAPDAPRVFAQSNSEIEIAWNAVLGATHYKLYRSETSGGLFEQVGGDISVTRYRDDTISAGASYYYRLEACNGDECSGRSFEGSVAPAAPTATAQSDSEISITWNEVAGATHYKLYRAMVSGGSFTPIGGEIAATGYLDSGLSVKTAYYYRLEACNNGGCSGRSPEVLVETYGSLGAGRDEIKVGLSYPIAFAFSGRRVYVVDLDIVGNGDKIVSYPVRADGILGAGRDEITTGLDFPYAIAFSGGRAYVVDSSRRSKIISYPVGADGILGAGRDEITTGLSNPQAIAFLGGRAYVADINLDKIISYPVGADGVLGAGRDEITTDLPNPQALAFSGGRAYVVNYRLDKIISYPVGANGELGAGRDEITTGLAEPRAIAFSGGRAYVADRVLDKIISYPVGAGGELGAGRDEITDGLLEEMLALVFSGDRAYVADIIDKIISYPVLSSVAFAVAPDAPRVVAQSDSEIEIAWNAVLGATHYKLYRSATSGGMYDQIGGDISITRYLNDGLSANTSYYYQLEACSGDECSGRSPEVSGATYADGSLGAGRDEITTGLDRLRAIAFSGGRAYVADAAADKIISYPVEADGRLGAPRDEITAGLSIPRAIVFLGGRAYVVDSDLRKIISYPVGANGVLGAGRDEITTGLFRPAALAFSGGRAYVADVDPSFGNEDKIISYAVGAGGELGARRDEVTTGLSAPFALAFLGGRLYMVDKNLRKIISYPVEANGVLGAGRDLAVTASSFAPTALAFSGGRAYVMNGSQIISYVVGAGGELSAGREEITTGLPDPLAFAISGGRMYVVDGSIDKIISYPLFSSVPFAVAPDAPRVFGQSESEIEIAWNAVLGATHYKLYRSETSGGTYTQVGGDISATRYRDGDFSGNTFYYYQLEACNGNECSERSPEVSVAEGSLGTGRDEITAGLTNPLAIAFSGGRAYVADTVLDKIISYPVGANGKLGVARDEITTGLTSPRALAFSGERVYVADLNLRKIISYPVGASGELGAGRDEITTGLRDPTALAISGGRVYVTDIDSRSNNKNKIISYSVGANGKLSAGRDEMITGLSLPFALAFFGGRVYVANLGLNKIISYPVGTGGVLGAGRDEITTDQPRALAFSGGRAYVAGGGKIISYPVGANGQLGAARDEITTGLSPLALAISGGRAYVTDTVLDKIISYPLFLSVPFAIAPDAPRVVAQNEIEIDWDAFPGATHYKLYRSATSDGLFTQIGGNISVTRYRDDFSANIYYYYQLEACNSDGCSERSPAARTAPAAAAAAQSGDEISITWSAVAGATHYKLYRATTSGGLYRQIGGDITAIGYLDSDLFVKTAYYYRLEACNSGGCSGSIEVSAATYGSLGGERDEITAGLSYPFAIAFSGGRAYVADPGLDKIISYPVGANGKLGVARDEITGLPNPIALAFSGGRAYVVDTILDKIISYPVGANGQLGAARDEITAGLTNPLAIAFSGGRAYVADTVLDKIISYPVGANGKLGVARDEITTGLTSPRALAFSGGRVYVADIALSGDEDKIISYPVGAGGKLGAARDEITTGLDFPIAIVFSGGRVYVVDNNLAKIISYPVGAGGELGGARDEIIGLSSPDAFAFFGGRAYLVEIDISGSDDKIISYPLFSSVPFVVVPDAPRAFPQSTSEIEIAWNAVLGATHYKLYRSKTSGGAYTQVGGDIAVTRYLDGNLSTKTFYYYQLEACNGDECSGRSFASAATYGSLGTRRDEIMTGLSGPRALAFSGGRAYVADGFYRGKIISYPVGAGGELGAGRDEITAGLDRPQAIAFSGGRAYLVDSRLYKIISYPVGADGRLGAGRDEITGGLDTPTALAFSGGRAYVGNYGNEDKIISYPVGADGVLGAGRNEITTGLSYPIALAFSGGRAYVADLSFNKIISYPVGTGGRLSAGRDEITGGLDDPSALAFSGGRAYLADSFLAKIISYPVGAGGRLSAGSDEITAGLSNPFALAFSGGRAYVADFDLAKIISYPLFSPASSRGAVAEQQRRFHHIVSSSEACNGDECSQRLPKILTATRSASEGVFHASGWVVGLDYQYGDGETGKTGEKGAFPLRSGETVVFSTGQVTLGAVSIASDANADFFTPTRLGDQARAIRIERLLIALDSDGENDNGVVSLNAESASDALTAWNATRASDDEAATPINGRMRAIPSAATAATLLKRANNCGFSGAFAGRWTDAEGNGGEHAMVLLAFNEGDIDGVSNPRGVFAGIDQITGGNGRNGKALWIKLWNQGGGRQSAVTKYGAASGALSIALSAFPVVATMTASNGVVMTITVESYGKIGYAVGGESGVLNRVRQEIPNADYRLAGFYSDDDRATPPGEQKPEIGIFAASIDGESEKLEPYIGRFLTDGAGVYSNIGHSKQDAAYTRQGTPADGTITIVAADGREIELRFTEQRDGVGYGAYEDTDANGDDGFDVFGGWCKL